MSWLDGLRHGLRTVLRPGAYDRELREEFAHHQELRGIQRGPHRRRFGNATYHREETRLTSWLGRLDTVGQDIRYAVRGLRNQPVFTAGVIVTLGLGIGANAVMFGVTDRLLFRPPPMLRDPATVHRLYRLSTTNDGERVDRNLAFPTYLDLRRLVPGVFSTMAAFQTRTLALGDGVDAAERSVTVASADFFGFFDARPALGRFFTPADDSLPAGRPVVVLGWAYWMTAFGGEDVIGRPLRVGNVLATIIGVAPRDFVGMSDQGVPAGYMPITAFAYDRLGPGFADGYRSTWLEIMARRQAGVTEEQARTAVAAAFFASWRNAFEANPRFGAPDALHVRGEVGPVQLGRGPQAGRDARVARWVSGVALIVLLIACANVTNLMLARAVSRRREVAMRLALGVSRGRLVRQLMTESAVIAAAGGLTGLLVAASGGGVIRALYLPGDLGAAVFTDPRTVAFALFATAAAAFGTGIVPAIQAGRGDVAGALKAGERAGGERRSTLRRGLLVTQATLSVLLLVGAALFVGSLANARDVRLGYDADRLLVAELTMRGVQLDSARDAELGRRMLEAAASVPAISHAASGRTVPFYSNTERGLWVPGVDSASLLGRFLEQQASPDYFATLGTRIVEGRAITGADRAGAAPVIVVSEGMARTLWPAQDPLGRCIHLDVAPAPDARHAPCTTVVGVAEEAHLRQFTDRREFAYYVPAAQMPDAGVRFIFARADGDAALQAEALRKRLQALAPPPAYVTVMPLTRLVDPSFRAWRFGATMFTAFGGLALLLSAIGLYSLIAYEVAQRAREMSVRIALGAPARRVIAMVMGRGALLVAAGVAAGLGLAAWIAPALSDLVYGVEPRNPAIFAGVALALMLVSVVATAWPAARAARVDPAEVLRAD